MVSMQQPTSFTSMKRHSSLQIIGVLLACALLPVMTVGAGKGKIVERPFKAHGYTVIRLDLTPVLLGESIEAPWTIVEEVGFGTHTGRWTSSGSGTYNVVTEAMASSGTMTVASGDVIEWDSPQSGLLNFTAGTGRFANVSGTLVQNMTVISEVPEGPYLLITVKWTAAGTIAY
jgi:hypothetical protein